MDMEVEVEGEDGSKFALGKCDNKAVFGRGSGFNTRDRTVSRCHVSFQLDYSESELPRVSFEVTGKNPVWVWTHNALKLFRKFDKGHLQFGDRFSLSGNTPFWFGLKKNEPLHQINLDEFDVSQIDPVREFGFLVMGHEFDQYPKGMIRNVKDWEWFLEEPRKHDEDEEDFEERKKMRRKRKACEDDEWNGENEEDKDLVANVRRGKLPGYSTRSRDSKGPNKDTKSSKNSNTKKATSIDETDEEEEDDEDDETLGGFIVDDEDDHGKENDEDEEEEFEDDDDDDDDDG